MIIFPSSQGRLITSDNPAGMIKIGQTITVAYALKLIRTGRARFVGVDASKLPSADNLKIQVTIQQAPKPFGFIVKDTRQPKLDITINPKFMAKVKGNLQEAVVQQGNLNITLASVPGGFKIISIVLD
jgi:hypothetical protein